MKVELREAHGGDDWLVSYAYSDGGGQGIQTVTQAEPDASSPSEPRWVVSGRVEIDNKGNVSRQYEPFYADDEEFDFALLGVSAVLEYDPVGRNTKRTLPDGHVRTWSYGPWEVSACDENDSYDDEDNLHFGTPTVTHLDSLGRVYKIVELAEMGGDELITALTLDVQGNPREVIDPRGNTIQVQTFDMLGRPMFTGAADEGYDPSAPGTDKGQTRALLDVASQPFLSWRSGDLALKQTCDAGRRPVALYVTEGSVTRLVTLMIYGDVLSDTPTGSFARGRVLHVYDTAGRVTLAYDFRGRTVEQTRQVFEDINTEANWDGLELESSLTAVESWLSGLTEPLDTEEFTVTTEYDALDRVTSQTTPDGSVMSPGYDAGGKLQTVSAVIDSTTTNFVTDITYNARGQRTSIAYGNTTHTTTTYDPNRFWPTRILTEREDDAVLQDLNYSRDPVGNITEISDDAQETVFFSNAQVSPTRSFTYDAMYRLIGATGREKVDQTQSSAWYSVYAGTPGSIPDAGNPALRSYYQSYQYDAAGNLEEMKHQASVGGTVYWRRGYAVAANNNQLLKSSILGNDPDDPGTYSDQYAYNDRGAMTFMPHLHPDAPNLTRDYRDQIRSANTDTAGTIARYAYDASGQRVRKVVVKESVQEERIYVGSYEVWRKRSTGVLAQERQTLHIMDGQRRIALVETLTVDDSSPPEAPSTRVRYQLDDHLGTAALETDEAGAVISYEEYHPYGSTAWYADDGSLEGSPKRYKYTGMERDDETGLQYHSARYYAPWLGRWTGADPSGLNDHINRHLYCRATPVSAADRSGNETQWPDDPIAQLRVTKATLASAPLLAGLVKLRPEGHDPKIVAVASVEELILIRQELWAGVYREEAMAMSAEERGEYVLKNPSAFGYIDPGPTRSPAPRSFFATNEAPPPQSAPTRPEVPSNLLTDAAFVDDYVKSKSMQSLPDFLMAGFYWANTDTIYIADSSPGTLFHEYVHALESKNWAAAIDNAMATDINNSARWNDLNEAVTAWFSMRAGQGADPTVADDDLNFTSPAGDAEMFNTVGAYAPLVQHLETILNDKNSGVTQKVLADAYFGGDLKSINRVLQAWGTP